jgi:hypothetical protein
MTIKKSLDDGGAGRPFRALEAPGHAGGGEEGPEGDPGEHGQSVGGGGAEREAAVVGFFSVARGSGRFGSSRRKPPACGAA